MGAQKVGRIVRGTYNRGCCAVLPDRHFHNERRAHGESGAASKGYTTMQTEDVLTVDARDQLPAVCPHCHQARAICIATGALWRFQCVHCGRMFTQQARALSDGDELQRRAEQYLDDQGMDLEEMYWQVMEDAEVGEGCAALDGCLVELDATCEHGFPSWALFLGLV